MALFDSTRVGLRTAGQSVTVADDPKAKLMYYLDCMCSVLELDDSQGINRLRHHERYNNLTPADTSALIRLCTLFEPNMLLNICIFQNDSLCGDSANKFFHLETVQNKLLVAGSVMIGGQKTQVKKIMTFKMSWLLNYFFNPMIALLERQQQEKEEALRIQRQQEKEEKRKRQRQQQEREAFRRSKTCIIL